MSITREEVKAEYDRCIEFAEHPEKASALYGISDMAAKRDYFMHKAEALGWVLDRWKK